MSSIEIALHNPFYRSSTGALPTVRISTASNLDRVPAFSVKSVTSKNGLGRYAEAASSPWAGGVVPVKSTTTIFKEKCRPRFYRNAKGGEQ